MTAAQGAPLGGGAHLTHALALHATLPPLGRNAGALAPGALR